MAFNAKNRKLFKDSIDARNRAISHVQGLDSNDSVDLLTASDVLNVDVSYMKKIVANRDIDSIGTGDDACVSAGTLLEYRDSLKKKRWNILGRMIEEDEKHGLF